MKVVCTKFCLLNKSIIASFLFTVCALLSKAQTVNLVPDPSFEDTISSQNYNTQLCLKNWKNLDSTRLNACITYYCNNNNVSIGLGLPNVNFGMNGFQYARTGAGVIGFDFQYNNAGTDLKSITRVKLKNKLIFGKTYCVKVYAVFMERYAPYVTDGLQLYFDNGGLDTMISIHNDSSSYYPLVVPQISLAQGQVLTDTVNWNLLMGSFVANGTEEFLTIGNFKSNSATTKIIINPGTLNDPGASLLIDDVSVYPIDLANWLPPTYGYAIGDSALLGLPNYETPDAKWYTYNMQLIDSGSQIKVLPPASGTKYICGIDMCNTMVFDTVEVVQWPLGLNSPPFKRWDLKVWPNPPTDVVNIRHAVGVKVYVFNAVGELVLVQEIKNNQAVVNVSNLAKGLYVIKTSTQVGRFVKE